MDKHMKTNIQVKYIVGYVHNQYLIEEYIRLGGIELEVGTQIHMFI